MDLEDNPVFQKYNGKTIRVDGIVYSVRIFEWNDTNKVQVNLDRKYGSDFVEPSSRIHPDQIDESAKGDSYYSGVLRCHKILKELEDADIPEVQ